MSDLHPSPPVPIRPTIPSPRADTASQSTEFTNPDLNQIGPLGSQPPYTFLGPPRYPGDLGSIDGYRITKLLGEGGMGLVFQAEDETLRRSVALKVMKPHVASSSVARERFLREGRAAASFKSDYTVTIHQVGEANGIPFLAMEHLDGWTLDNWLKQKGGTAPVPSAVRIAKDVLRGLAAAHDKGLVHRDIKPGNLWIEKSAVRVKVLDFGLTRAADGTDQMTQEGAMVGTPAYMSPEQARGEKVDARSDLFSLGVVLYRVLTGNSPYQRATTIATIHALTTETPPPLASILPEVPNDLSSFIERLMAKEPSSRPTDTNAALSELAIIEKRIKAELKDPSPPSTPNSGSKPVLLADATPIRQFDNSKLRITPQIAISSILVGLATLIVAGIIIIKITSKDGTTTEIKVPEGGKVELVENGKTVVVVPDPAKLASQMTPDDVKADRAAAIRTLDLGGSIGINGIGINGKPIKFTNVNDLPSSPFRLTEINLSKAKITDDDLKIYTKCNSIIRLNLMYTPISNTGLAYIPVNKNLEMLSLIGTKVTDDALCRYADCDEIINLQLGPNGISEKGLLHFEGSTQLRYLTLLGRGINDRALENFRGNDILVLSLSGSSITDKSGTTIGGFSNLDKLYVEQTSLTDKFVPNLMTCKRLKFVNLHKTQITPAGIAELRKMHPKCEIAFDQSSIDPEPSP